MSFDFLSALQLAEAVIAKQPVTTTIGDIQTLYTVYSAVQGKTFDAAAMSKAGTLEPAAAALARSATILDALLKDQTQGPRVVALIQSL